ncbi:hypothetical protein CLF_100293 [Clonorchis sinensis]|uniref:Uncharacterized protein n=1 Tax=Clonorchis sinensis TaxID=79923 RepID=G7Y347_CLOSI|nr:hypothetical protein CLF_100293 [Clonorchis sinensis]
MDAVQRYLMSREQYDSIFSFSMKPQMCHLTVILPIEHCLMVYFKIYLQACIPCILVY